MLPDTWAHTKIYFDICSRPILLSNKSLQTSWIKITIIIYHHSWFLCFWIQEGLSWIFLEFSCSCIQKMGGARTAGGRPPIIFLFILSQGLCIVTQGFKHKCPKRGRRCINVLNLESEVIYHQFCHILFVKEKKKDVH